MNRADLRRIWRSEKKRFPTLTFKEYLRRREIAQRAREALIEGNDT